MQVFPTKRLPAVVQSFVRALLGARLPSTVWLKTVDPAGPRFRSSFEEASTVTMVNLATGEAEWSREFPRLNPFAQGDWREHVANEERELYPLTENQALVVSYRGISADSYTNISVYTTKEAQVLYFDLGNLQVELTEPELFALATLNVRSGEYRNRLVRWLTARGVNVPAAYSALAARKLVRVAKNGAVTELPEGRLRRDQADVKEKYRQMDRES